MVLLKDTTLLDAALMEESPLKKAKDRFSEKLVVEEAVVLGRTRRNGNFPILRYRADTR